MSAKFSLSRLQMLMTRNCLSAPGALGKCLNAASLLPSLLPDSSEEAPIVLSSMDTDLSVIVFFILIVLSRKTHIWSSGALLFTFQYRGFLSSLKCLRLAQGRTCVEKTKPARAKCSALEWSFAWYRRSMTYLRVMSRSLHHVRVVVSSGTVQ